MEGRDRAVLCELTSSWAVSGASLGLFLQLSVCPSLVDGGDENDGSEAEVIFDPHFPCGCLLLQEGE